MNVIEGALKSIMENTYLQNLACKFLSGEATDEEKHLLHLWYDTEWSNSSSRVHINQQDNAYETGKRLFAGVKKAGGGK